MLIVYKYFKLYYKLYTCSTWHDKGYKSELFWDKVFWLVHNLCDVNSVFTVHIKLNWDSIHCVGCDDFIRECYSLWIISVLCVRILQYYKVPECKILTVTVLILESIYWPLSKASFLCWGLARYKSVQLKRLKSCVSVGGNVSSWPLTLNLRS